MHARSSCCFSGFLIRRSEVRILPGAQPRHSGSLISATESRGNVFACVAKCARHPDEFVQEFCHTTPVSWIGDFSGRRIEQFASGTEVDIPKNRNQPEFTQDREQALDHTRAAEWSGRYAADADGSVDIFYQVCIEQMLQQTGETMIVFRNDEYESIGAADRG